MKLFKAFLLAALLCLVGAAPAFAGATMCAADVAGAASGNKQGGSIQSVSVVGLTAQSTTSNSPILPAGAFIVGIIVQETSGNAVTGGLDVGIAGSSDATIVSAFAVAANALVAIPAASILKNVFAATSVSVGVPKAQQIFFNAHTNWTDGATINVTILYSTYEPF